MPTNIVQREPEPGVKHQRRRWLRAVTVIGLALTGLSLYLQSAAGDFPNEPGLAMLAAGQSGVLPMLLVGVCAAEVRHHLSGVAQAALGHWMVVDALFAGFVAVCFCQWHREQNDAFGHFR